MFSIGTDRRFDENHSEPKQADPAELARATLAAIKHGAYLHFRDTLLPVLDDPANWRRRSDGLVWLVLGRLAEYRATLRGEPVRFEEDAPEHPGGRLVVEGFSEFDDGARSLGALTQKVREALKQGLLDARFEPPPPVNVTDVLDARFAALAERTQRDGAAWAKQWGLVP